MEVPKEHECFQNTKQQPMEKLRLFHELWIWKSFRTGLLVGKLNLNKLAKNRLSLTTRI